MSQKPTNITGAWADGPFNIIQTPKHQKGGNIVRWGAVQAATEMCLIHNVIIRILNCIYLQAPNIKSPTDITDFTTFMHAWVELIHEHHGNEEELFFPWLEEYIGVPNYMSKNVDQHHAFAAGMTVFEEYIKSLRAGTGVYDGAKVRTIVDGFGETLTVHLREEVEFFVELDSFGTNIDWQSWNKRVSAYAVKTANTEFVVPIVVTNMDLTFEKGMHDKEWPPFPWFVALIFRWFYVPKHKGAWRFSCCDPRSRPKELEFV